jgi:hypothetical protein
MGWERYGKVGDKIVCIRDESEMMHPAAGDVMPKKDQIYTIRGFEREDDDVFFYLEEIRNQPGLYWDGYGETCFHSEGFRPIQDRKTDISSLTKLLNTAPADELEDA